MTKEEKLKKINEAREANKGECKITPMNKKVSQVLLKITDDMVNEVKQDDK